MMYVCMSITRISVSCMLHVRGVRKGYGRTIVMNVASNAKNGKKTMHADAMDGSISTEDEDSNQRGRRL